jgi:preprotein translocase subunit YajC
MHTTLHLLVAASTPTTTHSTKKSSGSTYTLLIIIVLFAGVYLFLIRPRQQRARQQQTAARQLSVGDAVVTAGGLYGRLVSLDGDTAKVEVAPGVVLTMLRRAVSLQPDAPAPSSPSSPASPSSDSEDFWQSRGHSAEDGTDDTPEDHPDQQT